MQITDILLGISLLKLSSNMDAIVRWKPVIFANLFLHFNHEEHIFCIQVLKVVVYIENESVSNGQA
jgi:hypothetical protein